MTLGVVARHAGRLVALLAALWLPVAVAQPAPPGVPDGWVRRGHGEATFWGLRLYGASLYFPATTSAATAGEVASLPASPFALALRYARDIDGRTLVATSMAELSRMGLEGDARLPRWQQALARVLPDVRRDEVLVGVRDESGRATFLHNGQPTGTLDDVDLVAAFFGIWLADNTRDPGLRARLLGRRHG